jgi:hypothetical protein
VNFNADLFALVRERGWPRIRGISAYAEEYGETMEYRWDEEESPGAMTIREEVAQAHERSGIFIDANYELDGEYSFTQLGVVALEGFHPDDDDPEAKHVRIGVYNYHRHGCGDRQEFWMGTPDAETLWGHLGRILKLPERQAEREAESSQERVKTLLEILREIESALTWKPTTDVLAVVRGYIDLVSPDVPDEPHGKLTREESDYWSYVCADETRRDDLGRCEDIWRKIQNQRR